MADNPWDAFPAVQQQPSIDQPKPTATPTPLGSTAPERLAPVSQEKSNLATAESAPARQANPPSTTSAANPWAAFPAVQQQPSTTADKYAGWDVPNVSSIAPSEPVPLRDDPNKTYGSVLPLAMDNRSGALEPAVPEMIRAPVRGVIEGGQEARGVRPVNDPAARTDITAAVGALGARPAPGEATGYAAARGQPGDVAPQSPVRPAALTARMAGYRLPPDSISKNPGMVSNALAYWGDDVKTQRGASKINQNLTQSIVAKDLGLPPDTNLTPAVLKQVRDQAGQAYEDVQNAVPTVKADQDFQREVSGLGGNNSQAAQAFPNIMKNPEIGKMSDELMGADEHPTGAWMELVKKLRFQGNGNLKAVGDPSKHALGLAQREAANSVDDLIERNISDAAQQSGNSATGNEVGAYRAARQLIAKSYDIEGAMNPATGDVNALGLARLQARGRPFTGGMKTIADTAAAFPKSMQPPASFGYNDAPGNMDFFAGALALAHGNPHIAMRAAAMLLGRTGAKSILLSDRFQNRLANQQAPSMSPPRLPLGIADQQDSKQPGAYADGGSVGAPDDLDDLIQATGARYGIPASLLHKIMMVESGGKKNAISDQGAQGPMQLMPETAKALGVTDPFDYAQALDGGARLLRQSLDRNNGRVDQAVAEYHGGPDRANWGPKTAAYVSKVLGGHAGTGASATAASESTSPPAQVASSPPIEPPDLDEEGEPVKATDEKDNMLDRRLYAEGMNVLSGVAAQPV